ncbi:hypothetical protein BWI15_13070 [Kribbella sp. ALI-6-A]|uniref:DUF4135 domain-containing protein n=1 Tax=Kribbella sp. ALI-6-A TaxID=1933817 RepID=UPI00097BF80D|nr:DUF4135 domain-containing protein [Kribbella sp. ALI-6-A]ONI74263.1 hypothetical protein BWI15_13070 [Kribbella sp. ALI-6-A]
MTDPAAVRAARDALVSAVHARTAAGLFPPVVALDPDGLVRVERQLSGPADAEQLAGLLDRPDSSILLEMFATLTAGCDNLRTEFPGTTAAGILRPTNGALFGPLVGPIFLACLSGTAERFRPVDQAVGFLDFLQQFLRRLRDDARRLWFDGQLPVTGLTAHDGETHNGRRRVLRVDFPDGRSVAYKPRPADVGRLFLAPEASAFALLNSLSETVRLPVMELLPRDGYEWQTWIERPAQWDVIRPGLSGAVLTAEQAELFWHRAGSLTAACFGFGITDLSEGNLYVGGPDPLMYPIDLELAFVDVRRLSETGLVAGEGAQHHHVGLETQPRLCAADGPTNCLVERDGLQPWRRTAPWARDETRTVVADTARRTGYGAHLGRFLRGMFDAWTLMCTNVSGLRAVLDQPATTRVLLRSTSQYGDMLDDWLLDGTPLPDDLDPAEREQLLRHDVPYFYRSTNGGPLRHWDPETSTSVATGRTVPPQLDWAGGLTLSRLGTALRDAVAPIATELHSPTLLADDSTRVAVQDPDHGAVSFDWAETNRWVCYRWNGSKVTLQLAALDQLTAIRERLLKLDGVDAAWRAQWAAGRFTDDTIAERLTKLTTTAATWLQQVIDEHGWPGPLLVGEAAAKAACRLVQHLENQPEFQRACLDRLTAAVDVPPRHVAYLTDALCVAEGRPQVYGTKFNAVDGQLVPCPLEDPDAVDERRQALGLQPLADYAERLREKFPLEVR